jgi:2-amino-4-hydroxy-6-hydroxymethyldihydropteridine diphosphokinase
MHESLIAFGSNEGNRAKIYADAIQKLDQVPEIQVVASSQPLKTASVGGPENQEDFLNAAIRIKTSLDPHALHSCLIEIEDQLGRERRTRWGSRKIDLDLLLFDEMEIETLELTIPHPRMSFRWFVLQPASEVAGDMIHPSSGLSIDELKSKIQSPDKLVLLTADSEHKEFFSEIRQEIANRFPSWTLRLINNADEFGQLEEKANLVAHFEASPNRDQPLQSSSTAEAQDSNLPLRLVKGFRGPRLKLPRELKQAAIELIAAVEAMQGAD